MSDVLSFIELGRKAPSWFLTHALDVKKEHLWHKMEQMLNSVRDNELTCVQAGHAVSKTYTLARLALQFLYCHCPSTVITTAPSQRQVKGTLWREIHAAFYNAKVPLGGKLTTTELDLQDESGRKWFATGFTTKADTVTQEATKMQGYHNEHMLIIFDEAADVLPEIWRAGQHIGAPFKRWIVCGNATSAAGEFADAIDSDRWHHIKISVTDTPNFKTGRNVIPGVYGRDYEREMRIKYGVESDEYGVRVLGEKSRKAVRGSYYSKKLEELRNDGRFNSQHNPHYCVHIVGDIGYTSAWWFFQLIGTQVNFVNYYEDSDCGIDTYCRLFDEWKEAKGYYYGKVIVPCDMDSNATKVITGASGLETMRQLKYQAKPLPRERRVTDGIQRTLKFLDNCYFCPDVMPGVKKVAAYHERINKRLSTEENPVFTGEPEKDGNDHAADALRYVSLGLAKNAFNIEQSLSKDQIKDLQSRFGYA